MKFIYPEFLFALSAIIIPIIIHLFNFRKFKKVYFTNVRFLREIKQDTQAKSKLKHLLVLLSRILAIIFLVLAFAQPYIPQKNQAVIANERAISIYIDNSFSMDAIGKNGVLLEEAKRKAKEIATAYKSSDRFQLLTNDFEGRHQRLVSKEEFLTLVDEVKSSPSVKKTSEVISRQSEALSNAKESSRFAYLLSDFQQSTTDIEQYKVDTTIKVQLLPLTAQQNTNLYIDSCWFSSPIRQINQSISLMVKIKNKSDAAVENIPVKFFINEKQKALGSVTVEANSSAEITLPFTITETGWQSGFVSINDYPVTFDDHYYLSFEVAKNIAVLTIHGENETSAKYLKSVYNSEPYFLLQTSNVNQIDYSSFNTQQLILLNEVKNISTGLGEELKKFISKGGCLVIFPHADLDMQSYQQFLQSLSGSTYSQLSVNENKVAKMNVENELFNDVFEKIPENMDLPLVKKYFSMTKNSRTTEEKLLQLQNGESFLSKFTFGKGKVYLFTVPLDAGFSNFAKHALFVPVMYRIALLSIRNVPLAYTIGKDDVLEYDNANVSGDEVFHIKKIAEIQTAAKKTNDFDIIPEHKLIDSKATLFVHNQIKEAGNYSLNNHNQIAALSFNYNRKESDLKCFSADDLNNLLEKNNKTNIHLLNIAEKDFATSLNEFNKGKQLWKLCIIFVLLFLAFEVLLLRFWK